MVAVVGNFIFALFVIAVVSEVVRPGSQTGTVINDTEKLLSGSIKAAKS